ncbi:hypothetical protein [Coprobacter secundus]|uniref:hypothetical protein n=1 Tax=Coprobacter secundus TaxID=1501392 RepID=UPI0012B556D6|nr:hypothetical protein [Coprobacter secundus]
MAKITPPSPDIGRAWHCGQNPCISAQHINYIATVLSSVTMLEHKNTPYSFPEEKPTL